MEKLHVLVVDDELGMRMAIRKALRNHRMQLPDIDGDFGFEIDLAETGEEAIEKIMSRRPDILLLDYKLPGMSGLDLLERVAHT